MDAQKLEFDPSDPNRRYLLYGEEIARCPELGEYLKELEKVAAVRNQIRNVFGTEEPDQLRARLGQSIGGNPVTEEVVAHATVISEAYTELKRNVDYLLLELAKS